MKTKTKDKQRKASNKKQEGIRMDDALKARVTTYQEKLKAETGLDDVSFSSAARSLLEKALDAAKIP